VKKDGEYYRISEAPKSFPRGLSAEIQEKINGLVQSFKEASIAAAGTAAATSGGGSTTSVSQDERERIVIFAGAKSLRESFLLTFKEGTLVGKLLRNEALPRTESQNILVVAYGALIDYYGGLDSKTQARDVEKIRLTNERGKWKVIPLQNDNSVIALAGGAFTARLTGGANRLAAKRSSESRSGDRTREANEALTAHLQALNPDLTNLNKIASFRTAECPLEHDGQKWVKARGSYAECERRMGFRWVSPTGHCYPEGLCPIPQDDIVQDVKALQNQAMLLTTLTQVHNQILKKQRDDFIANKKEELYVNYTKSPEFRTSRNRKTRRDFEKMAETLLPQNLRKLPERAAIVDEEIAKLTFEKPVEKSNDEETEFVRQAFLQVYSDWVAETGIAEDTPASDAEVKKFVEDSIFCSKANIQVEKLGPLGHGVASTLAEGGTNPIVAIEGEAVLDRCSYLPLQNGGLFMPKLAVERSEGGRVNGPNERAYTSAERNAVKRAFKAGKDPLALAFRFVSEKYLERSNVESQKQAEAYSPQRKTRRA